ncbi:MAG: polyphosphate--glucose phosphotransferase [Candidatus Zixiibacteriota bacterium]
MNKNTTPTQILGIDIGGSGIKSAPVDTARGRLLEKPEYVAITNATTPDETRSIIQKIIAKYAPAIPVGIGYPGVIKNGMVRSAANVSPDWLDKNLAEFFRPLTSGAVRVLNDADAAGLAEMKFGAGKDYDHPGGGTVLLLTLGTGIGSALFYRGQLFPNTEFGHVFLKNGREGESIAAASVRVRENLTWTDWAVRLNYFLKEMEKLFTPDLIILGGGIVENFERFRTHLKTGAEIRPAETGNDAGLIGAAYYTSLMLVAQ